MFQANDDQSMQMVRKEPSDDEAKGEGQWVMGSDVIDEHNGFLAHTDECKAAEQARHLKQSMLENFKQRAICDRKRNRHFMYGSSLFPRPSTLPLLAAHYVRKTGEEGLVQLVQNNIVLCGISEGKI